MVFNPPWKEDTQDSKLTSRHWESDFWFSVKSLLFHPPPFLLLLRMENSVHWFVHWFHSAACLQYCILIVNLIHYLWGERERFNGAMIQITISQLLALRCTVGDWESNWFSLIKSYPHDAGTWFCRPSVGCVEGSCSMRLSQGKAKWWSLCCHRTWIKFFFACE